MTGTFGPSISAIHLERWIMDFADEWFLDYLAESERVHTGVIPGMAPRFWAPLASIINVNDWEGKWPDDQLPCLLVINTGIAELPERHGDGTYTATWMIAAAIVVSTATRKDTRNAAIGYGHAFKQMILQNKSLGHPENIESVAWVDERPVPLPTEGERSLMAMQMLFNIGVKGVLTDRGSTPLDLPRPDPYEPQNDFPVVVIPVPTQVQP